MANRKFVFENDESLLILSIDEKGILKGFLIINDPFQSVAIEISPPAIAHALEA